MAHSELRFVVLFYAMTVVWSLTTALRLLWEIIKHPIASLQKTKRTGKTLVGVATWLVHNHCMTFAGKGARLCSAVIAHNYNGLEKSTSA